MKRTLTLSLFAVSLAAAFLLISCGATFEVKIPKKLIVEQAEKKFPTVKNKGLMAIEISNPKLDFNGSKNRILVGADATIRFFGLVPINGRIEADGTLEYKAETGSFIFSDVKVQKFNIKEIPESQMDEINGLITSSLISVLGGMEVYKLDPKDSKENIAKMALRGIRVADDGVIVKLGLGK